MRKTRMKEKKERMPFSISQGIVLSKIKYHSIITVLCQGSVAERSKALV